MHEISDKDHFKGGHSGYTLKQSLIGIIISCLTICNGY